MGLLVTAVGLGGGCGPAERSELGTTVPTHELVSEPTCRVRTSVNDPLIVEWPAADRSRLEVGAQSQVMVVRYDGCEMEVLQHCRAPGSYRYSPVSPKQDNVSIRTVDELYTQVPIGAAGLERRLERSGELTVAMTMVGRLDVDRASVGIDELEGDCGGATHVLAGMTLGAFEFFAGSKSDAQRVEGLGRLARGSAAETTHETISRDGSPAACAHADAQTPPIECRAPLRVEVVRLGRPVRTAARCPDASTWDGNQCVRTETVTVTKTLTEMVCPAGSNWDGQQCVIPVVHSVMAMPMPHELPSLDVLRGDGREGEGWHCFSGTLDGHTVGRCDRDAVDCGVKMGKHVEVGMPWRAQRCEVQAQAACFGVRLADEQHERRMCFPDVSVCRANHANVALRKDVQHLGQCALYR